MAEKGVPQFQVKNKSLRIKKKLKKAICEKVYISLSFLFKYCVHLETILANTGARQVQEYFNNRSFIYKGAMVTATSCGIAFEGLFSKNVVRGFYVFFILNSFESFPGVFEIKKSTIANRRWLIPR